MAKSEQEIEVKFLLRDLTGLARRLESQGAVLASGRVFESNLRFDTPERELAQQRQVLRLRKDTGSVLTYKGPAQENMEVSSRQEIEFQVGDFGAARRLLEALGYEVAVMYEKYRTTYHLGDFVVVLDEMPFGNFVEIEGPDPDSIRAAAADLGLDWEARSTSSYLALFDLLRQRRGIAARNLSFDELQGVQVGPQDIGLRYADGGQQ